MKRLTELLFLRETSERRNESCKHYNDCLNKASKEGWVSFACDDCKDYVFELTVIDFYRESVVEPKVEGHFSNAAVSRQLTKKMRELGIPVRGDKPGNAEWREWQELKNSTEIS